MALSLYLVQRLTAVMLVPFVLVHLGVIIYATDGGITAAEILERTRENVLWPLFYGGFVIAAALHGSIGLRNVLSEWSNWRAGLIDLFAAAFCFMLVSLGLRAVWAVA